MCRTNGLWEARYTAADGRKRSLYARTKREATERLREALRDTEVGILPTDRRLTTAQYLRDWLEHDVRPRCRPATFRVYGKVCELYLIPEVGRIPLAKLTPEHVQAMLARLSRGGDLSPTTVRYCGTVLRVALARAERHGRAHRNVAALVDAPAVSRPEVRPLSAADARMLLAAVKEQAMAPLIVTALGTGARQGELLALRWRDLDLDVGLMAIRHTLQPDGTLTEPRTERSRRVVTLPRAVTTTLRAHRRAQLRQRLAAGPSWQDGDYVFARPDGRPLEATAVRLAYRRALEAAGLPRQRFHALRHAYASLQLEAGEELANVSKMLGHASLSTTADIYGHLTTATQRRAAERMDRILTG